MKNKEIKQIIFSRKKNKKWIIIALVLVLTLGGGSVAAVGILHRNGNQSEFSMPGNMAGLTFTEDMTLRQVLPMSVSRKRPSMWKI